LAAISNGLSLPPVLKETLLRQLTNGKFFKKNFDGKNTRCIFAVRSKRAIVLRQVRVFNQGDEERGGERKIWLD
jgi:hypothetical protein